MVIPEGAVAVKGGHGWLRRCVSGFGGSCRSASKSAPPIKQTRPLTWVGLSGLEPLTSSLSGKRSNRLSYRPWARSMRRSRLPQRAVTTQTRQSSSARVTSRPPSRLADRLYRNAPRVARAVTRMTSITAIRVVNPSTRDSAV
jgi:hypothetical protein